MLNIPDETPEETTNPVSVEELERKHPAMLEAIAKAVRKELETSHTNGHESADIQPGTGKGCVMDESEYTGFNITDLSTGKASHMATYLFAHSGKWMAELTGNSIRVDSIGDGKAIVTFPAIAEVDMKEFMSLMEGSVQ